MRMIIIRRLYIVKNLDLEGPVGRKNSPHRALEFELDPDHVGAGLDPEGVALPLELENKDGVTEGGGGLEEGRVLDLGPKKINVVAAAGKEGVRSRDSEDRSRRCEARGSGGLEVLQRRKECLDEVEARQTERGAIEEGGAWSGDGDPVNNRVLGEHRVDLSGSKLGNRHMLLQALDGEVEVGLEKLVEVHGAGADGVGVGVGENHAISSQYVAKDRDIAVARSSREYREHEALVAESDAVAGVGHLQMFGCAAGDALFIGENFTAGTRPDPGHGVRIRSKGTVTILRTSAGLGSVCTMTTW